MMHEAWPVVDDLLPDGALEYAQRAAPDGFSLSTVYSYTDAAGNPVYLKARYDCPGRRKTFIIFRTEGAAYRRGLPPDLVLRPLYQLPALARYPSEPVWLVEGEKAAAAISSNAATPWPPPGALATTSGGSHDVEKTDWEPLRGRRVVVWPDNDSAGAAWLEAVRKALDEVSACCVYIDPAALALPPKGDAADYLLRSRTM